MAKKKEEKKEVDQAEEPAQDSMPVVQEEPVEKKNKQIHDKFSKFKSQGGV